MRPQTNDPICARHGRPPIAVVGAGAAGLVTAMRLVEAGHGVEIFEAGERLGDGAASWLAGGMLAPFCEAGSADPSIVAPGLEGIAWWVRAVPGVVRRGTLVVAPWRDRADLHRFAGRTEGHQRIDTTAIAALEPDLAGRFAEALFLADEAHLDPRAALVELRRRIEAAGGILHLGRFISPGDLERRGEHAAIVDARGMAGRDATPSLRAVRGEMLILKTDEIALSRPVRLLHPRSPIYVVPRGDGRFMVGATMVEADDARGITLRGTVELLNAAYALHPAFAEAELIETGAGLRPSYPDNLPRVTREGSVVAINGLHRHGFLLSPAMARDAVAAVETIVAEASGSGLNAAEARKDTPAWRAAS